MDALEKIVLGPERPLILSRADKERIAYTEALLALSRLIAVFGEDHFLPDYPVHLCAERPVR